MNKVLILCLFILVSSCNKNSRKLTDINLEKKAVNSVISNWHEAASNANFEAYFSAMDSISVFIGTDATENWTRKEFEEFSKPYFVKGKAWSFVTAERNVYLNDQANFAWFDELLQTWMGACRGSGVLEKKNDQWKIKHYVLSVTVPNEDIQKLIDVKFKKDSIYLKSIIPTP